MNREVSPIEALYLEILKNPDDDGLRLIWADAMEETGNVRFAGLPQIVRAQILLKKANWPRQSFHWCDYGGRDYRSPKGEWIFFEDADSGGKDYPPCRLDERVDLIVIDSASNRKRIKRDLRITKVDFVTVRRNPVEHMNGDAWRVYAVADALSGGRRDRHLRKLKEKVLPALFTSNVCALIELYGLPDAGAWGVGVPALNQLNRNPMIGHYAIVKCGLPCLLELDVAMMADAAGFAEQLAAVVQQLPPLKIGLFNWAQPCEAELNAFCDQVCLRIPPKQLFLHFPQPLPLGLGLTYARETSRRLFDHDDVISAFSWQPMARPPHLEIT
jgi:uncharacterized protein (TIGR02996 family)